jgi:hypothetical protein
VRQQQETSSLDPSPALRGGFVLSAGLARPSQRARGVCPEGQSVSASRTLAHQGP